MHLDDIEVSDLNSITYLSSVLISGANVLVKPIKHIFNLALSSRDFPDIWKCSYLLPLHKSASRQSIYNYRDITILSALP